jgi:hypothetical protein
LARADHDRPQKTVVKKTGEAGRQLHLNQQCREAPKRSAEANKN